METNYVSYNQIAYSFQQLIKNKKNEFKNYTREKKEENAMKIICDPDVSKSLLNEYLGMINKNEVKPSSLFETFKDFYHTLQYSLTKNENLIFYEALKKLNPQEMNNLPTLEYLTKNDPINNFKNIYDLYSPLVKEMQQDMKAIDKIKENIMKIKEHINLMLKIYDINFDIYYIPPMKEYPIYVYNFYSYQFFKTLNKFQKKLVKNKFNNMSIINENTIIQEELPHSLYEEYSTEEEIEKNQYNIGLFFEAAYKLFEKFNPNNIDKDLKILKILLFYFQRLENTRNFLSISKSFQKIIDCMNSEPINADILDMFKFYRKNSDIPIKKEEWDSIGINEEVYTKHEIKVKIKHYRKDLLLLNKSRIESALSGYDIDDLNLDGLINYSITKFSPEIEDYSKKLLKCIFSSDKYLNNFIKHDKRFSISDNKKYELLKDIFTGQNSKLIFDEIWENIFFIPFLDIEYSGFNNRNQYTIFIKSNHDVDYNKMTFQKVIPRYQSEMNTLFHEYTHNIALIIAFNLDDDKFETISISEGSELDELKNLQNEFYNKYGRENVIYNEFDDFGDLMEIEMFGINPHKFKSLSGLYYLCCDSFSNEISADEFRNTCAKLYNLKSKDDIEKEKDNYQKIISKITNSEIANILKKYFPAEDGFKNESYTEDGKPRGIVINSMFNEEYSINIDYCDKLNKY